MPPKKGTARRARIGDSDPPSTPPRKSTRLSPNLGTGALPHIPTKHSFAYGSSATPILPHMLAAKPKMNIAEMANTIEDAVQTAKEREINEVQDKVQDSPARSTHSRRRTDSPNISPPRRTQRQPTPDEIQLINSLHEASIFPERANSNVTGLSTATPPPPVRHSFSTTSSPARDTTQQLYPPPLQESGSPVRPHVPLDPLTQRNNFDGSSVISWNVERDIHDDDLQRIRSNITAPPRRFSGFAFAQGAIPEDEPAFSLSESDQGFMGAPARTIIPDRSFEESPSEVHLSNNDRTKWGRPDVKNFNSEYEPYPVLAWVLRTLIFGSLILFAVYTFKDSLFGETSDLHLGGKTPGVALNNTGLEALNSLSHQVVNLGAQVSSLSKDMKSMRAEVSRLPVQTTVLPHPSSGNQERLKTNFLSIGSGVLIDPYMTSPTAEPYRTFFQKVYMWMTRDKHRRPQPPRAALTPWEDMGECWCSVPRNGMSQIGILLGRRIVPEAVVVEHMPKAAAIKPEVTPQEMELWARYRYVGSGARPYRSWFYGMLRGYPENIAGQDILAPDRKRLHKPVMEALRMAWRGEEDSGFSNDKLLGPDYYRLGKWTYDIHSPDYVQKFAMTAIIDSEELRVDKVVIRVTSNWGANETCLYRVKLHGKL